MPTATYYPVFEPDQVLTDEHLNAMFAYLDQQDQLTRNKLLGIGVACGLNNWQERDASIHISKGVGITSLGYLLQFQENSFTHFRSYTVPDFPTSVGAEVHAWYEALGMLLLVAEDAPKLPTDRPLSTNRDLHKSHAVVLFLEPNLTNLKNCTTEDCNDKGKRVDLPVRAMLVPREKLSTFKYFQFQQQRFRFPPVNLKRWNVPAQPLNHPVDILAAFDAILTPELFKQMAEAFAFVHDVFNPILGRADGNSALLNVQSHLAQWQRQLRHAQPVWYQYLYDYVDDLIQAYKEFGELVFEVVTECCPDEHMFPLHLTLGMADGDTRQENDPYRNQFIHSPLFGSHKGLMQAARHAYRRMLLMVEQFQLPENMAAIRNEMPITITPSVLGAYPPGQRCIPFYYKPKPLVTYWDYEKTRKGRESYNQGFHAENWSEDDAIRQPLLYDTEPYNFYRIEGHTGKPVRQALRNLVNQKNRFNLPIDIVALNLYPGTELADEDKLACYFNDLESAYNVLLAEMLCKLHGLTCAAGKFPFNAKVFDTVFATTTTIAGFARTNLTDREFLVNKQRNETVGNTVQDTGDINLREGFERFTLGKTFKKGFVFTQTLDQKTGLNFIEAQRGKRPYTKGSFLKAFCPPAPDSQTIAGYYINWAAANAGKRWPKPQPLPPGEVNVTKWATTAYYHMFYLIDVVEELVGATLAFDLGDLPEKSFKLAYDEAMDAIEDYADYFDNYYHALDLVQDMKDLAANKEVNHIAEQLEDWIVDKVVTRLYADCRGIMMMCVDDRIEQLKVEYAKRLKDALEQVTLAKYADQKQGLEHKAGVPKGGTFVLLYYDLPNRTAPTVEPSRGAQTIRTNRLRTNANVEKFVERQKTIDTTREDLSKSIDAIRKITDANRDVFAGSQLLELNRMLDRVNTIRINPETGRIPEGQVFADLYLPYMCCSSCAPTAFVFPDAPEEKPPLVLQMDRSDFCNHEDLTLPIKAEPAGGVVSGQGVIARNGGFSFNPSGLPEGSYTLTYRLNDQVANLTVQVKATPNPDFNFVVKGEDTNGGIIVVFTAVNPAGIHSWDFGNGRQDTAPNTEQTFVFQGTTAVFSVRHAVTNGNCALPAVVKQVTLVRNARLTLGIRRPSLCSNDAPERLTYSPDGGTMVCKENPAAITLINGIFHFAPALAGLGNFTIIYTLAQQSQQATVAVAPAPSAEFVHRLVDSDGQTVTIECIPSTTAGKHEWQCSDNQKSVEVSPKFKISTQFKEVTISHLVDTDPCRAIAKKLVGLQLPEETARGTMNLCYSEKLRVPLEPNLTPGQKLDAIDAGIHSINGRGELVISDQTPVGVSSFIVRYRLVGGLAVVAKQVQVTINRLEETIRVQFFAREGALFEAMNKGVIWKIIADNNGQLTTITENRRENPLTLKLRSELPFGVSTALVIEALLVGGPCRQIIRRSIPGDKYKQLMDAGGELKL